jgi:serine/threonine protein phosphatase PrpC
MTTSLCGGINGLSDADCRDWREVAKAQLATSTLDPMRRDYRGKEDESVREIVEGDVEDIQASQFVLVNATRPSWGTAMEMVYAHQCGKLIFAWVGDSRVSPWLRFHSDEIHVSLEDAVKAINYRASLGCGAV